MAKILETMRSSVQDSIKGRKLGLDNLGYLVGPPDVPRPVTDLTSASTATSILPYGITRLMLTTLATSAAGATFLLSNPVVGASVTVLNGYTSTGALGSTSATLLRPSTAFYILSSEGTTMTTIVMSSQGFVTLTGLTTDSYQITSRILTSMASANGTT